MEWQLHPPLQQSSLSGKPFTPGDWLECFIFQNEEGLLQRVDLHPQEAAGFEPPSTLLARWRRKAPEAAVDSEKEARAQTARTAEELFTQLMEEDPLPPEKYAFAHGLALLLERGRILRFIGRPKGGYQRVRYPRGDTEFVLPEATLSPEALVDITLQLNRLLP